MRSLDTHAHSGAQPRFDWLFVGDIQRPSARKHSQSCYSDSALPRSDYLRSEAHCKPIESRFRTWLWPAVRSWRVNHLRSEKRPFATGLPATRVIARTESQFRG